MLMTSSFHYKVRGYMAGSLHGDMSQAQRDRVMRRFREGKLEIFKLQQMWLLVVLI